MTKARHLPASSDSQSFAYRAICYMVRDFELALAECHQRLIAGRRRSSGKSLFGNRIDKIIEGFAACRESQNFT